MFSNHDVGDWYRFGGFWSRWCLSQYNVICLVSIRLTRSMLSVYAWHRFWVGNFCVYELCYKLLYKSDESALAENENGVKPNKEFYLIRFKHLNLINVLKVTEWETLYPNTSECLLSCVITSGYLTLNT